MALTLEQKNRLLTYVAEGKIEKKTAREIAMALNTLDSVEDYTARNVASVLAHCEQCFDDRCSTYSGVAKWSYDDKIILVDNMDEFFETVKKEKNILTFTNNGVTFTYDFNKKKELITDKPVNYKKSYHIIKFMNRELNEWVFNYIDLWDVHYNLIDFACYREYGECPKGFINYLKENNQKINPNSYRDYKTFIKLSPLKLNRVQYNNFLSNNVFRDYAEDFIANDKLLGDIVKCAMNDIKNLYFFDYNSVKTLLETCHTLDDYSLDTNRGILDNKKLKLELLEAKQNELLHSRLRQLNFINGKTFGDYVVVVPQTLSDLQNEGRQQNNCVGHYYNRSIVSGENLIYFLRKKSDPTKSVVTCRYNTDSNYTVESRTKNNYGTNAEQNAICDMIDEIIIKELGKRGN